MRLTPYEAKLKLRRAMRNTKPGVQILGEAPVEVETPDGMLRITVAQDDGPGVSMWLRPAAVERVLAEADKMLRPLFDPTTSKGVNAARQMIKVLLEGSPTAAAPVVAAWLAWNHPGVHIPTAVANTLAKHGRACIALTLDWRLGMAATAVTEDYSEIPIRELVTAAAPAWGNA